MLTGSIHGTAKHANIISVKVLDQYLIGQAVWILEGFEWIFHHMDETSHLNVTSVINIPFGIYDPGGSFDFLDDVIRHIPAVSVAAAGNEDTDACDVVPARFSSVITVAAINSGDRLPVYTNYGPCVDLLAPGHNIISASHRDETGERQEDGTSMSAGFVSGNYGYRYFFFAAKTASVTKSMLFKWAKIQKYSISNLIPICQHATLKQCTCVCVSLKFDKS